MGWGGTVQPEVVGVKQNSWIRLTGVGHPEAEGPKPTALFLDAHLGVAVVSTLGLREAL